MADNSRSKDLKDSKADSLEAAKARIEDGREDEVNPITKASMAVVGLATSLIATKLLEAAWSAIFHEKAPTKKNQKQSKKALKQEQKAAKKAGFDKGEIKLMKSDYERVPAWRVALFTLLSGAGIGLLRQLSQQGAKKTTQALISRRPPANRG